MLPEDGVVELALITAKCGREAQAFEWSDRVAAMRFRVAGAGRIQACRHDVGDVGGLVMQRIGLADYRRPARDERGRDSAFVHPMLEEAERRIRGIRPR